MAFELPQQRPVARVPNLDVLVEAGARNARAVRRESDRLHCAAVANLSWLEVRPELFDAGQMSSDQQELFSGLPVFEGDGFVVPDAPGLGIDFDEERAFGQSFRYWNPPQLRRRDGSHTNW